MYFGDAVTVLPDKIRISERELAPLGILDKSKCWGRWVPDRRSTAEQFEHLVVSPFDIASWPVLFRLALVLDDDCEGALTMALKVLHANAFNILSIEGAPAGHHHSAINIIGEASDLKADRALFDYAQSVGEIERTFLSPEMQEYVHKIFAPSMLAYSQNLVQKLYVANRSNHFLRPSFVYDGELPYPRGTLYDPKLLPDEIRSAGRNQCTEAVRCIWQQNHAFFWLYGRGPANYKTRGLTYNASNWALYPDANWVGEFRANVNSLQPPFKAITSLNFDEQYLRVAFSASDERQRTVRAKLQYVAEYTSTSGSSGLLEQLCSGLSPSQVAIRSINLATQHRDQHPDRSVEVGTFVLLVAERAKVIPKDSLAHIRGLLEDAAARATESLDSRGCNVMFQRQECSYFAARILFLSTKFEWLDRDRPELILKLKDLALKFGFRLVMADHTRLDPDHQAMWDTNASITNNITKLMRNSDAFLQLNPKHVANTKFPEGNLNWLLFETGAAHALKLPCAVCVDTGGGLTPDRWNEVLKAGAGEQFFHFSSDEKEDNALLEALNRPLSTLAHADRPTRRE